MYALDARERAPSATTRRRLHEGWAPVVAELSQHGGLAVAVPGEVRGLGEMVRRWGKLPFRRCVEPAQRLAARGFPVSWRLAREHRPPVEAADPPTVHVAVREQAAARGRHLAPPDLAWTLGELRAGPDAFYKGEIREMVAAVRGGRV